MADINHVVLVGRITRDAELKYINTGSAVIKLSLAINRRRKQGDQWIEEANFFDVVIWGKTAEALKQYLVKGKQIAVEGELHQNKWEQDGQARSKVEIVARNVQLLGGGREGRQTEGSRDGSKETGTFQQQSRPNTGGGFQRGGHGNSDQASPNGGQQGDGSFGPENPSGDDFEDDIPF